MIDPRHGAGGAVIEFDRAALMHAHQPTPYRYHVADEAEERLRVPQEGGSTEHLIDAITHIHMVNGVGVFDRYASYVLADPEWAEFADTVAIIRGKLA